MICDRCEDEVKKVDSFKYQMREGNTLVLHEDCFLNMIREYVDRLPEVDDIRNFLVAIL